METTCKLTKLQTMKIQAINQKASFSSLLFKASAKDCKTMHSKNNLPLYYHQKFNFHEELFE